MCEDTFMALWLQAAQIKSLALSELPGVEGAGIGLLGLVNKEKCQNLASRCYHTPLGHWLYSFSLCTSNSY